MKSYWHGNNYPESKTIPEEIDVAIIGGGLSGVSLAYWLSFYQKANTILIIEKEFLGFGASGRNAGFMTRGSAHYYYTLCEKLGLLKAREIYKQMGENHKLLVHHILGSIPNSKYKYSHHGSYTLVKSEEELNKLTHYLTASEIPFAVMPTTHLSNNAGFYYSQAIYQEEFESSINPVTLLYGIYKKALMLNKNIFWIKDEYINSEYQSKLSKQVIHLKNRKQLLTNRLIFALNGYTKDLNLPCSTIDIEPCRAQMQQLQFTFNQEDRMTTYLTGNFYDPENKVYFRQVEVLENGGILLIGGLRILDEENEVGTQLEINRKIQKALFSYAKTNIFHPNTNVEITKMWCGIMGFTQNLLPVIKKDPHRLRTYYFAGFNGHGLGLIFFHAKEFAQNLYLC